MATLWIYALGDLEGGHIKFGKTAEKSVVPRLRGVDDSWHNMRHWVVLTAVRGTPKDEAAIHRAFAQYREVSFGNRKEYFHATDEVAGYVNWLRSQWYASADGTEDCEGFAVEDPSHWLPTPERCQPKPPDDPSKLFQDYETRSDNLAGTPWTWMVEVKGSFQDYFTPPEIINAAREAMGDVDLDAASHWGANKIHRIPDYFHVNKSAFDNRWYGRVWLNPPYGDNPPWFREILRYVGSGDIEQLCMLSPVHTFSTAIARPVMALSSAFLLLSPTPKFWGNVDGRTGTNLPHGVLYIGSRRREFIRAFAPFGFPMTFQLESLEAA